jgi:CBS domain-containing protein
VREVMHPLAEDVVVGPDASLFDAFVKASRNGVGRLAVLDGPRLAGYVSLRDITHVLALRASTSAGRRPPAHPPRARYAAPPDRSRTAFPLPAAGRALV